jgi:hypothetical protein
MLIPTGSNPGLFLSFCHSKILSSKSMPEMLIDEIIIGSGAITANV